jgi:hypothetical protein
MGASKLKIEDKKLLTPKEQTEYFELVHRAIYDFSGPIDQLESAIGFLYVGKYFGWKTLYIIHSKATVAKYEAILGIDVREHFPETNDHSPRSNGFRLLKNIKNYWNVIRGDEKLPDGDRRGVIQARDT